MPDERLLIETLCWQLDAAMLFTYIVTGDSF